MTIEKTNIIPGVGFGQLKFGMSQDDVEKMLGKPEKIENPDEDGNIVYIYETLGINFLVFDKEDDFRLTTIELNKSSGGVLWNCPIFNQPVHRIEILCEKNGFTLEYDCTVTFDTAGECFESAYHVNAIQCDFYMDESDRLKTLCFGVIFNDDDEIIWPALDV